MADKERRLLYALALFSVLMVMARIIYTLDLTHAYLIWNLLLAWLPYIFSKQAVRYYEQKNGLMIGTAFLWILFLPNSAYIITDFIHLNDPGTILWYDILLIFSFSLSGLLFGLFSIYNIHALLVRFFTGRVSWFVIFGMTGLSGLGIYVGRFFRWNSWEVFTQPFRLIHEFWVAINDPYMLRHILLFSALFGMFQVFTYGLLYFVKGPVVVNEKISFSAYLVEILKKPLLKKVSFRN
ncbi:MAG: DUF1361 domain-containing protein [Bacteroidetes bacterium]|jgi:uncharacterized membrane protein|nr:DUF1361 domain-containing protein [Bacteroidota bacterium]